MPLPHIEPTSLSLLTSEQARAFRAVPVCQVEDSLHILGDESTHAFISRIQVLLGMKLHLQLLPADQLNRLLGQHYPESFDTLYAEKIESGDEPETIRFINEVIARALAMGASDIHLECYEKQGRVRFRWQGQLVEKYLIPQEKYRALISRLKVLAALDIAEKRLPQDGRITFNTGKQDLDLRLSTLPGKYAEKAVLRLLIRQKAQLDLKKLGFSHEALACYRKSLRSSNGIILITGPTGSGKTTTLYASLHSLNSTDKNLLSAEDPIEYQLEGVNQVQVKPEIGLDFERLLRAFLRQDPDIIMIGEIRDLPTARIALRAALTGHLVFSTLHTNSAWDALTRLQDMGLEPYLLASAIRLVAAQRLIRCLCPHCKQSSQELVAPAWQSKYQLTEHMVPKGCPQCHYTGYLGRKAVFELLPIGNEIADCIKKGKSPEENWLKDQGMQSLNDQLILQAQEGTSSIEEILSHLKIR